MKRHSGAVYGIAAAVLFGASTPAAKPLLGNASPLLLAGLLYLGSGFGLFLIRAARRTVANEAPLRGYDWLWLGAATFFGGILGPVVLMTGLARSTAATASLLLNLEAVATALVAWLAFREHASRRTVTGMTLILAGAVVLAWSGKPSLNDIAGPLAIAAACVAWAFDNNLTRRISASDPLQIAMSKSLAAGIVNTALALTIARSALPNATIVAGAALIGFFGYGVSLVCYILALRHVGTARTGAYFATAPFVGAGIAAAMGSVTASPQFFVSTVLMIGGVWLHLTEHHSHEHAHEAIQHEHAHVHDEHHQHAHAADDPAGDPHVHQHRHEPIVHEHAHFPDIHHHHGHAT